MPRAKARFVIAFTLSAPKTCCVMPMLQTKTAVFDFPYISAKACISSLEQPDCFSRTSHGCLSKASRRASKPVVCSAMNVSSIQPSAIRCFMTPFRKAMSPPV